MNFLKQEELNKLIDDHELWLNTDSKEGNQLFLQNTQLHDIEINNRKLDYVDFSRVSFQNLKIRNTSFTNSRLIGIELIHAELDKVNFKSCTFKQFGFHFSVITDCDFTNADIYNSEFNTGNIKSSTFENSEMLENTFKGFGLHSIEFKNATFGNLSFIHISLSEPKNLDTVNHRFESYIDANSVLRCSQLLPQVFLRGIGIDENLIDYLPSLSGDAIQFYSCFISYSKDQIFADRIHSDLQNKGIRCWLYTEDIKIGDKFRDKIYQAIKMRDKLLIVISENSENSEWVEEEVLKALDEEKKQKKEILFPIMIDDIAMKSDKPWIQKIKNSRHIGDFRGWDKDPKTYVNSLERLIRDLKTNKKN